MTFWNAGDEVTASKLNAGNPTQSFTFGESIAVNDAVYLKSDGKVYKTDADYNDERIHNFIGFAKESGNANDVKLVQTSGVVGGFTGLTIGNRYFLSGTAGAISSSGVTYVFCIGIAVSSTELLMYGLHDFKITTIASDNVRQSNDTLRVTGSAIYVKVKEIKVNMQRLDNVRIKWILKDGGDGSGGTIYGRFYINGVARGGEYDLNTGFGNVVNVSENFSNLVKDDLLQVYAKMVSGTIPAGISNFSVCYDEVLSPMANFINQDP